MTDHDFIQAFLTKKPKSRKNILEEAAQKGVSRTSVDRYLARLIAASLIRSGQGLYWV